MTLPSLLVIAGLIAVSLESFWAAVLMFVCAAYLFM